MKDEQKDQGGRYQPTQEQFEWWANAAKQAWGERDLAWATLKQRDDLLADVLCWAREQCPDNPGDPCSVCGESAATGVCKSAEKILPRRLLERLVDSVSDVALVERADPARRSEAP